MHANVFNDAVHNDLQTFRLPGSGLSRCTFTNTTLSNHNLTRQLHGSASQDLMEDLLCSLVCFFGPFMCTGTGQLLLPAMADIHPVGSQASLEDALVNMITFRLENEIGNPVLKMSGKDLVLDKHFRGTSKSTGCASKIALLEWLESNKTKSVRTSLCSAFCKIGRLDLAEVVEGEPA